jgi:hypothetical protein
MASSEALSFRVGVTFCLATVFIGTIFDKFAHAPIFGFDPLGVARYGEPGWTSHHPVEDARAGALPCAPEADIATHKFFVARLVPWLQSFRLNCAIDPLE